VNIASNILSIWNWLMLFSLAVGTIQTLILTYKSGEIPYAWISVLVIVCLIMTAIGMFIVPSGAILS
ncbi:MAG TPA: hypothetical protein PKA53_12410, partial [Sphingobacterium sp.]|nr:hypothetical protein [Sphingobacterium sp.]